MKMKLMIIAMLLSTIAQADEVLINNMKDMRNGLVDIQDGFLYNKKDKIISGIKLVKNANGMFANKDDIAKHLPANKKHMANMGFNSAKNITKALEQLDKNIKSNNYSKGADSVATIIKNCTSCHSVVRGN
jgi:CHAD domain-containing protein